MVMLHLLLFHRELSKQKSCFSSKKSASIFFHRKLGKNDANNKEKKERKKERKKESALHIFGWVKRKTKQ
jgi:hypothetical protein